MPPKTTPTKKVTLTDDEGKRNTFKGRLRDSLQIYQEAKDIQNRKLAKLIDLKALAPTKSEQDGYEAQIKIIKDSTKLKDEHAARDAHIKKHYDPKELAKRNNDAQEKYDADQATLEKNKVPPANRFIPTRKSWNERAVFKSIIPSVFKTNAGTRPNFTSTDLDDMYNTLSGKWDKLVHSAQAKIYTDMTPPTVNGVKGIPLDVKTRAQYIKALKEKLAASGADYTDLLGSATSTDKNSVKSYWENISASKKNDAPTITSDIKNSIPSSVNSSGTSYSGGNGKFDKGPGQERAPGTFIPGTNVEGLGKIGPTGKLTRGITRNLGGGQVDTSVMQTEAGDFVDIGPQNVSTVKKTLRGKFDIAGGESVRPDEEDNIQSDALFEAFSWLPDGYGQGPNNQLHLMNKQNETFRFGMEPLSAPRQLVDTGMTHPLPMQWSEAMPAHDITNYLDVAVGMEQIQEEGYEDQISHPIHVMEHDYNNFPSSKKLPRQIAGPSPFETVTDTSRMYYPAYDPSGAVMDSLGYYDVLSDTLGNRRLNVFS